MKKGFTLVEILIAISISVVIGWAMISVLKVADVVWNQGEGLIDLQQQARQAMDGMIREARQSKAADMVVSGAGSRVDFSIPSASGIISYFLEVNDLTREHPSGAKQKVAANINSLSFCCVGGADCADCINADALRISLGAGKNIRGRAVTFPVSGSLTEQVRLRN